MRRTTEVVIWKWTERVLVLGPSATNEADFLPLLLLLPNEIEIRRAIL